MKLNQTLVGAELRCSASDRLSVTLRKPLLLTFSFFHQWWKAAANRCVICQEHILFWENWHVLIKLYYMLARAESSN